MNKKYLLITGGTGGHVIPATNFANYLLNKDNYCKMILDKRGQKYIDNFNGNLHIVNSSNLNGSYLLKLFGVIALILGFFQSLYIIVIYKPNVVISFGSYASFFPMLSCVLLKPFYKTEIYIHEQNSILGRTNKFFLIFAKKLFLNFDIKNKINKNYINKTFIVGYPEKITNSSFNINSDNKFTISIFGGSQGSEYITNFSLKIIKIINEEKIINANYIIQCPKDMVNKVKNNLKEIKSNVIVKNYFYNIDEILNKTSIAISRSGAGSISDLINFKIPSILIPLPSSKDNHQFFNASIMVNYGVAIILDQNKGQLNKAKEFIYEIYKNTRDIKKINKKFHKITVKNSNSLIYKLINNEK